MPRQQQFSTSTGDGAEPRADQRSQRALALLIVLWLGVSALCALLAIFTPSLSAQ